LFSVMQAIRDHADQLEGQMFSTREVLHLGKRATVDVVLWRLVEEGVLCRLARGVFIIASAPLEPSAQEVAAHKARVFGKNLVGDHGEYYKALRAKDYRDEHLVFRVNGRASKFRYKDTYVHLKSIAARKISLGDGKLARFVRTLWRMGENECYKRSDLISACVQKDPNLFKHKVLGWLPTWLHEFIQFNELPIRIEARRFSSA
jgi:hypothetical protein